MRENERSRARPSTWRYSWGMFVYFFRAMDDIRALLTDFEDAWFSAGQGFGWTYGFAGLPPMVRIDFLFVFVPPSWTLVEARVYNSFIGSDHRPLIVDVLIGL